MTDDEFKQKLSEVAEWVIPATERETTPAAKKRAGRKSAEQKYQEEHEEVFLNMFEGKNPTMPMMLTKLKIVAVDCEDCGQHCPDGRHTENKRFDTNRPHWRKRCVTCKKNQNPWTGEYDLNSQQSASVWADYLRKTNPRYVKKADQIDCEATNSADQKQAD